MFNTRTVVPPGAGSGLVPMYLTEISPVNFRGAMGVLHQFALTCGILVSQIIGIRQILGKHIWLTFGKSRVNNFILATISCIFLGLMRLLDFLVQWFYEAGFSFQCLLVFYICPGDSGVLNVQGASHLLNLSHRGFSSFKFPDSKGKAYCDICRKKFHCFWEAGYGYQISFVHVIVTNHVNWHRDNLRSDRENTGNLKMQFDRRPCARLCCHPYA